MNKAEADTKLLEAREAYIANPNFETANRYYAAALANGQFGGNPPDDPITGAPLWSWMVGEVTQGIRFEGIEKPDNEADITVTVKISGNRLVALLNAYSYLSYQERTRGGNTSDEVEFTVETLRDMMSLQRAQKDKRF